MCVLKNKWWINYLNWFLHNISYWINNIYDHSCLESLKKMLMILHIYLYTQHILKNLFILLNNNNNNFELHFVIKVFIYFFVYKM